MSKGAHQQAILIGKRKAPWQIWVAPQLPWQSVSAFLLLPAWISAQPPAWPAEQLWLEQQLLHPAASYPPPAVPAKVPVTSTLASYLASHDRKVCVPANACFWNTKQQTSLCHMQIINNFWYYNVDDDFSHWFRCVA